jgi:glutamate formiminotransferase
LNLLFECVPNVSEGRDASVIEACARAIESSGAHLAHRTSDPFYNRSVFTFFGTARAIEHAAGALAAVCVERIDLRAHRGVHPRIGALDVFPVVPMPGATLEDAATAARGAAARMWARAGLPSIFYGAAALSPAREFLGDIRRGEFEGLAARAAAGERADAGDVLFHPAAGTAAVGARGLLIAVNFELENGEIEQARAIARLLRERSGGLRTLRAMGFAAGAAIHISFNVTDPGAVPLARLTALCRSAAQRFGARLGKTELIGLLPRAAAMDAIDRAFNGEEMASAGFRETSGLPP